MKPDSAQEQPAWTKTPVANLARYNSSGIYFARAKIGGKLIRQSPGAKTLSVAKPRLTDLLSKPAFNPSADPGRENEPEITWKRGLKAVQKQRMVVSMPLTLEQIVEETRHWPPEKVGELVGRLTGDMHTSDPETEAAWKTEIDRRIAEIQSGKVLGIPAEEVFEKARRILGR